MVELAEHVLDRFRLDGKVALVTGATGDIGSALARGVAAAGATLVATARNEDRLRELVADVEAKGGTAQYVSCDLTQRESVRRLAAQVLERTGGVDVLVNNAYNPTMPFDTLDADPDVWAETFETILWGPLLLTQLLVPSMIERGGGSIVNIGSQAATQPFARIACYGAAKAAMQTISIYMAQAWGRHNIRCNVLVPSIVASPDNEVMINKFDARGILDTAVFGRYGHPEEMAGPLVFLASEASSHVTGQVVISGGDLYHVSMGAPPP